ncbi:MAG: type I DNA topoisomerase [Pseudomonadota bacterium]
MGRSLVIVESPAKARTVGRFLGSDYTVAASIGHVRDLPESATEIPARYRALSWARLGVNVEDGFEPLYVVPAAKREQVKKLKSLLDGAEVLYLATDEDREGESISWHLLQVLDPKVPVHRMVFHEITREAIEQAVANPRPLDERLVRAQETRRILDRLFGYEVSPVLWRKVRPKLSAGRVQSVAVRLVVERERQRLAFQSSVFWDLKVTVQVEGGTFSAGLTSLGGRSIAAGADFDPATGALKARSRKLHLGEQEARGLQLRLDGQRGLIGPVEVHEHPENPAPPFITSTLQQEANRKLRWGARRTMQVAQKLYESGWITYMRTDSTALSEEAIGAARALIEHEFGRDYLPAKPRRHRSSSRLAQEAHEAIRPAGSAFRSVDQARRELSDEEARLYELIWQRTLASQMSSAIIRRVKVTVEAGDAIFAAAGKQILFPGFRRAYVESTDDVTPAWDEAMLPPLREGEPALLSDLNAQEHRTQPPPRLTEASLVKELEAKGIGRPSTYATIIETIQDRGYVFKRSHALVPTFTAFSVTDLLQAAMADLVDYQFTARMEDELDQIALGELEPQQYLAGFYRGAGSTLGLKDRVAQALESVDARTVCSFAVPGQGDEPDYFVRVGRYGAYLVHGEARADVPDDLPPDELTLEKAHEMLSEQEQWPRPLGADPETGLPVLVVKGPFGPYLQLGEVEAAPKKGKRKAAGPKRVSLLKGMDPTRVDLPTALALLSLPRALGAHPESGEPVVAMTGRFGPYLKCGATTRSLTDQARILDVGLDEAVALLAERTQRKGGAREPGRELGKHPTSGATISLRSGRFGPYVTDGTLNASVPKKDEASSLTLARAVELLARKAEQPPSPRGKGRGRRKGQTSS